MKVCKLSCCFDRINFPVIAVALLISLHYLVVFWVCCRCT